MNLVLAMKATQSAQHETVKKALFDALLLHMTPRLARGAARAIARAAGAGRKISPLTNAVNRVRHGYHFRRQARVHGTALVNYRRARGTNRTFGEQVADANDRIGVPLQTGRILNPITDAGSLVTPISVSARAQNASNWVRGYYRSANGKRVGVPGFYR